MLKPLVQRPQNTNLLQAIRDGIAKMCNCRICRRPLLGDCHRDEYDREIQAGTKPYDLPQLVAGRINGVPYCRACLSSGRPPSLAENLTPRQAAKLPKMSGG
jgi:hypothetical protein